MRILAFAFVVLLTASFSHSRNLASIRKDAFTVGVSRSDSASEYDFISDITKKMKIPRFRLSVFDNSNAGQKLLLEGKIDAIISKVNLSSGLEDRFLLSMPYEKIDMAVAVLSSSSILTLSDLDGKSLAFVPKEVSSEQILSIWKNSKPSAAHSLGDAISFLQRGTAVALISSRKLLESSGKDAQLRVFPNRLLESSIVALFAPNSDELRKEFDKALESPPLAPAPVATQGAQSVKTPEKQSAKERIDRILLQLDELKKELELLRKEVK
ncbi:MAG: transporter substrate-binding domain-containing protein [Fibromonadales bacterium]|nr:transporter substrate-binding domain-containing protein [Fibromonadales bacterium]